MNTTTKTLLIGLSALAFCSCDDTQTKIEYYNTDARLIEIIPSENYVYYMLDTDGNPKTAEAGGCKPMINGSEAVEAYNDMKSQPVKKLAEWGDELHAFYVKSQSRSR